MNNQFLLGFGFGFALSGLSFAARFLSFSGAVATLGLATVIFGVGGWKWTIPMLFFFLLSSLLSKLGRQRKKRFDSILEKTGTRDFGQVFANGSVGGLLAVCQYFFPSTDFYPAYVGSVAAVTADTWATEIGLLTPGRTFSVLNFRPVNAGISGGISWLGMSGSLLGAAVIAASISPWISGTRILFVIVFSGVVASLADSVLGATLQAEYECVVCGRTTERTIHCGMPTKLMRGKSWVNNDVVNWMCALCGTLIAWVVVF